MTPLTRNRGCWAAGCFRVLLTRPGGNREGIGRDLNGALGQVTRVSQPTRWVLNRVDEGCPLLLRLTSAKIHIYPEQLHLQTATSIFTTSNTHHANLLT